MKKLLLILVLLLIATAMFAQSTLGTGQWLHDCWLAHQRLVNRQTRANDSTQWQNDTMSESNYWGFLMGVEQTILWWHSRDIAIDKKDNWSWDFPDYYSIEQLAAITGNYLDSHPQEWDKLAVVLVEHSWAEAFKK